MKRLALLIPMFLFGSILTHGQPPEWRSFYIDQFNFSISFPQEPVKSEDNIDVALGRGTAHRWTLELPGLTYEASVYEFPELKLATDVKTLFSVFRTACAELGGGSTDCRFLLHDDQFGETGTSGGFQSGNLKIEFYMSFAGNRFYQATVVTDLSKNKENVEDRKAFLNYLLFAHRDDSDKTQPKLIWGLPGKASQDKKDN